MIDPQITEDTPDEDNIDETRVREIEAAARRMRGDIVEMIATAGSGHPGGSLSAADIVATLYLAVMRHDPGRPDWPARDRFVLSKGHAAPVLYAALAEAGYFEREHLSTLRKLGSILQGHPDSKKTPGVEVSTGSLGQGLAVANGIALALALDAGGGESAEGPSPAVTAPTTSDVAPRVYCLLGDGELQEGEVWEAAMLAAHYSLDGVTAIVDDNGLQIDGVCSEVMCLDDIAAKFAAFGWQVRVCDGHDIRDLLDAFEWAATVKGSPQAIVCRTVKGKGVSFMEGGADWHGKAPDAEQAERAIRELGIGALPTG